MQGFISEIEKMQATQNQPRKDRTMQISNPKIDGGRPFDWGITSGDYAKYRDIYPKEFYGRIVRRNLCVRGQKVLDVGTGTGVLPRNLYGFGAEWTGTDISENQIREARRMSEEQNMQIAYQVCAAEDLDFPEHSLDVITACQCFWYFDYDVVSPVFARMLKPGGSLLLLYMAWLPYEDKIAEASEKLVLKYSPFWTGAGETRKPIPVPERLLEDFKLVFHEEFDLRVAFTRESWNGRMKACRGVGASLPPEQVKAWEREHRALLERTAPEKFEILHYGALAGLQVRN